MRRPGEGKGGRKLKKRKKIQSPEGKVTPSKEGMQERCWSNCGEAKGRSHQGKTHHWEVGGTS